MKKEDIITSLGMITVTIFWIIIGILVAYSKLEGK